MPQHARVQLNQIYRGISLAFYGNGAELEHDFVIDTGADPSQIALRFEGAKQILVEKNGDLSVDAGDAKFTVRKPVAYQVDGRTQKNVDAAFAMGPDGVVGFRVGAYDRSSQLVIDPVFTFSTYLGGTGTDRALAVATDATGNVYVTGSTTSSDSPLAHAEQAQIAGCNGNNSCQDAFVTKLDPTGTNAAVLHLQWRSLQRCEYCDCGGRKG